MNNSHAVARTDERFTPFACECRRIAAQAGMTFPPYTSPRELLALSQAYNPTASAWWAHIAALVRERKINAQPRRPRRAVILVFPKPTPHTQYAPTYSGYSGPSQRTLHKRAAKRGVTCQS